MTRIFRIVIAVSLCVLATVGAACSGTSVTATDEVLQGTPAPAPPDLSNPSSAVESYLAWVSYSYERMDSDVCSLTMTPEESVRVDAYIQLNLQQDRGIEQHLLNIDVRSVSEETTGAIVVASEEWRYRYFTPATLFYDGPEYRVSYETTYSLVKADGSWVVGSVEASADGDVP